MPLPPLTPPHQPTPPVAPARDPREIVTEDAFRLAPELLGTPLARPWRRGAAIAIDGALVALLSNAPSVLFGFAAAFVLFRASRSSQGGYVRKSMRMVARFAGAVTLFVVVLVTWGKVFDGDDEVRASRAGMDIPGVPVYGPDAPPAPPDAIEGLEGIAVVGDVVQLRAADNREEAEQRAERMIRRFRRLGMTDAQVRDVMADMVETDTKPWIAAVVDSVVRQLPASETEPIPPGQDSLVAAYATALSEGDSARVEQLRPRLAQVVASEELKEMRDEIRDLREDREDLTEELEEARGSRGILDLLRTFADDLGLGFGWTGLYFTAFTALWQGRTPGKRLLGVRVIRLDGKPISWWISFERFGGYAASLATGLLGFFQILWDRNRQAIHDKIAETVVICD